MRSVYYTGVLVPMLMFGSELKKKSFSAKMRIAATCLEFKLSTSYSVIPMTQIKQCTGVIGQRLFKKQLGVVEMQYYVLLWLW